MVKNIEKCDDGNLDNNDGCDSWCRIEADFACNVANNSKVSVCKYTKPIKVSYSEISKQPDSNTLNIYFNLVPANLKEWSV